MHSNLEAIDDDLSINTNIIDSLEQDETIFSLPSHQAQLKLSISTRCASEKFMKQILRKFRARIKDIYAKTYGPNRYNFDLKKKR